MLKASFGNQKAFALSGSLFAALALVFAGAAAPHAFAQSSGDVVQPAPPIQVTQPQINSSTYQGSETVEKPTPGVLPLSLDDAIARGLHHNLGLILTSQGQLSARGQQLQELQDLLPTVDAKLKESVQETDLQAQGLSSAG